MLRKHERHEPAADALRHPAVVPEDVKHLVLRRPDGDDEPPAGGELLQQGGRWRRSRCGNGNRVERGLLRQAVRAVSQMHVDGRR